MPVYININNDGDDGCCLMLNDPLFDGLEGGHDDY